MRGHTAGVTIEGGADWLAFPYRHDLKTPPGLASSYVSLYGSR